jgi:hypothetical protein
VDATTARIPMENSAPMSLAALVLHPTAGIRPPDDWLLRMERIGLLGRGIGDDPQRYLVGAGFLQLVTFMGCSPAIRLEPANDQDREFCHIRIHGPWPDLHFLFGRNTRPPRCPACRGGIDPWRDRLETILGQPEQAQNCPRCAAESPPVAWNWRQQAGFGHTFVQIEAIFPGEAVPVDKLLHLLGNPGDPPWNYFYLQP